MKSIRSRTLIVTAVLALSVAGAACDSSSRDAREEAAELQQKADHAATEAQQKVRDAAQDAMRTADDVGNRTGAAVETLDVKTALMADRTVDASNINVDTMHDTRVVVLRGTVPSADQREQAGVIATREAEGYRIDNQLTIKARP